MKTIILIILLIGQLFIIALIYRLDNSQKRKNLEMINIEKAKDISNKVINYRKDTILPFSSKKNITDGSKNFTFGEGVGKSLKPASKIIYSNRTTKTK